MAARKQRQRIYWREQGTHRRAYGDFRDFGDVGGGREALRLAELQERRRTQTGGHTMTDAQLITQLTANGIASTDHHATIKKAVGGHGREAVEG